MTSTTQDASDSSASVATDTRQASFTLEELAQIACTYIEVSVHSGVESGAYGTRFEYDPRVDETLEEIGIYDKVAARAILEKLNAIDWRSRYGDAGHAIASGYIDTLTLFSNCDDVEMYLEDAGEYWNVRDWLVSHGRPVPPESELSEALVNEYLAAMRIEWTADYEREVACFSTVRAVFSLAHKEIEPHNIYEREEQAEIEAPSEANSNTEHLDLPAVREWARRQGYAVGDRGRVSSEVLEAYVQK